MHPAAFNFVQRTVERFPNRRSVVEFGGRDINGSVRALFATDDYTSVDLVPGRGVDVVADAVGYVPRDSIPDTIVCTEVLEHTARWADIVKQAARILDPTNGILICTCACEPRYEHSAVDGGPMRTNEYYGNVNPMELSNVVDQAGFKSFDLEVDDVAGDIRLVARMYEE